MSREAEAQVQQAVGAIPVAAAVVTADGVLLAVNSNWAEADCKLTRLQLAPGTNYVRRLQACGLAGAQLLADRILAAAGRSSPSAAHNDPPAREGGWTWHVAAFFDQTVLVTLVRQQPGLELPATTRGEMVDASELSSLHARLERAAASFSADSTQGSCEASRERTARARRSLSAAARLVADVRSAAPSPSRETRDFASARARRTVTLRPSPGARGDERTSRIAAVKTLLGLFAAGSSAPPLDRLQSAHGTVQLLAARDAQQTRGVPSLRLRLLRRTIEREMDLVAAGHPPDFDHLRATTSVLAPIPPEPDEAGS